MILAKNFSLAALVPLHDSNSIQTLTAETSPRLFDYDYFAAAEAEMCYYLGILLMKNFISNLCEFIKDYRLQIVLVVLNIIFSLNLEVYGRVLRMVS